MGIRRYGAIDEEFIDWLIVPLISISNSADYTSKNGAAVLNDLIKNEMRKIFKNFLFS